LADNNFAIELLITIELFIAMPAIAIPASEECRRDWA
jgi:hypothetical protein